MDVIEWDNFTCVEAARGGHLEVLKYVMEKGYYWDINVICFNAAEQGHIEILKWLVISNKRDFLSGYYICSGTLHPGGRLYKFWNGLGRLDVIGIVSHPFERRGR